MLLDLGQIEHFFTKFDHTAFRLEALNVYDVTTDGADVARYLRGDDAPNADYKSGWLKQLADDTAAGKVWSRAHILSTPLNDYLRYEAEWGYVYNVAAGEQIGIIDLAKQPTPDGLIVEEFWIFDDVRGLRMHYDDAGKFLGGEHIPADQLPQYLAAKHAAQAAAVPFTYWWAQHPEEHRQNWAA